MSGPWWDSSERRFRCCRVVMPPGQAAGARLLRWVAAPAAIWAGCMLARRSVSVGSPVFISSSVMVTKALEGWRRGAEALPNHPACCQPPFQPLHMSPSSPYPALQRVTGLQVGRAGLVALLQLRDAVPVVQLLRFILARPQVDAAPA